MKHVKHLIGMQSKRKTINYLETGFKDLAETCIDETKSNYGLVKIMVLGDRGTGKTTICKKYIEQTGVKNKKRSRKSSYKNEREIPDSVIYDRKVHITRNSLNLECNLELYDFQGNLSRNFAAYRRYLEQCDGFLLVYSQNNKPSFIAMIEIICDIHRVKGKKVPIVITGNKSDCFNSVKDDVKLLREKIYSVCASSNQGIKEIFEVLINKCTENNLN